MGNPAYYLVDEEDIQEFPVGPRYGSTPFSRLEFDLVIETEAGKLWVYKQATKRRIIVKMRITESQRAFFATLHEAVGGQETAFYFVPDIDDLEGAIYVRKEQNFEPDELDSPAVVAGSETSLYDYDLVMIEEPTGPEVTP